MRWEARFSVAWCPRKTSENFPFCYVTNNHDITKRKPWSNQTERSAVGDGLARGRQRRELTERARLYRERQKEKQAIKRDVTEKRPSSVGLLESRIVLLNAENIGLSDKLQAALDKIAELEKKLKTVTRHKK